VRHPRCDVRRIDDKESGIKRLLFDLYPGTELQVPCKRQRRSRSRGSPDHRLPARGFSKNHEHQRWDSSMRAYPFTPIFRKIKPDARSGSRSAIPFPRVSFAPLHAGDASHVFEGVARSTHPRLFELSTVVRRRSNSRVTPNCVIIDFVRARNRHVAHVDQESSRERQNRLTLSDCFLLAYLVAGTAFYPTVAWLLLS
jgi:hypothetical protein